MQWPYAMHYVMLMANSRLQVAIFLMPSEWSLGIGSATELGQPQCAVATAATDKTGCTRSATTCGS